MAEGFLEVYHARTVHPTTVAPTLATRGTVISLYDHGHQSDGLAGLPGARTDGRDAVAVLRRRSSGATEPT